MDEFFITGCFHSHKIAKSNFNDVKNPSGFILPSPQKNMATKWPIVQYISNSFHLDLDHIQK